MGLYIPNAKIPVSCNKCYEIGLAHRLRDLGGHCPRMDLHYSPDEQAFKGDRRVDCHLLDVPPHGRLIDADALHKLFEDQWHYLQVLDWNENPTAEAVQSGINWCINTMHDDAPTIIQASEEET